MTSWLIPLLLIALVIPLVVMLARAGELFRSIPIPAIVSIIDDDIRIASCFTSW